MITNFLINTINFSNVNGLSVTHYMSSVKMCSVNDISRRILYEISN